MTRKVLVLGKSGSSFLTVIRSLRRQGIAVHVGWCPPAEVARRSRYVRAAHELPPFRAGDDAWKRAFSVRKGGGLVDAPGSGGLAPPHQGAARLVVAAGRAKRAHEPNPEGGRTRRQ
jgi:hypothetical protein